MSSFDGDVLIPLFVFAIPIVAITGGITVAIVRTIARQRMIELAQRERIAAIERGIDPAKLPPLDFGRQDLGDILDSVDRGRSPERRAQGLLIGGLVTLFAGIGISVFLMLMMHDHDGEERSAWAVGLIPALVGLALLLSSWIVWPRAGSQPR